MHFFFYLLALVLAASATFSSPIANHRGRDLDFEHPLFCFKTEKVASLVEKMKLFHAGEFCFDYLDFPTLTTTKPGSDLPD